MLFAELSATVPLLTYEPIPIPTEDDLHLESIRIRSCNSSATTKGVALGFSNGFFLHGTGGIAKSYTVLGELERLGVDFKLFQFAYVRSRLVRGFGRIPKFGSLSRRHGKGGPRQGRARHFEKCLLGSRRERMAVRRGHRLDDCKGGRIRCLSGRKYHHAQQSGIGRHARASRSRTRMPPASWRSAMLKSLPKCDGSPARVISTTPRP